MMTQLAERLDLDSGKNGLTRVDGNGMPNFFQGEVVVASRSQDRMRP